MGGASRWWLPNVKNPSGSLFLPGAFFGELILAFVGKYWRANSGRYGRPRNTLLTVIWKRADSRSRGFPTRSCGVEQRRSRSDFAATKPPGLKIGCGGPKIREMSVKLGEAI